MFYETFMSICKGYGEAKSKKNRSREYESLSNYPMLYSSQYLEQMTDAARRKEEFNHILDHMYKHDAMNIRDEEDEIIGSIDSYKNIERKIIDRYWRV